MKLCRECSVAARAAVRVFGPHRSELSVSLVGVGSYLPDHRVSNEEILEYLRPVRPDGRSLEPEWIVKHLGIHERRLDYEFGGRGDLNSYQKVSSKATFAKRRPVTVLGVISTQILWMPFFQGSGTSPWIRRSRSGTRSTLTSSLVPRTRTLHPERLASSM